MMERIVYSGNTLFLTPLRKATIHAQNFWNCYVSLKGLVHSKFILYRYTTYHGLATLSNPPNRFHSLPIRWKPILTKNNPKNWHTCLRMPHVVSWSWQKKELGPILWESVLPWADVWTGRFLLEFLNKVKCLSFSVFVLSHHRTPPTGL